MVDCSKTLDQYDIDDCLEELSESLLSLSSWALSFDAFMERVCERPLDDKLVMRFLCEVSSVMLQYSGDLLSVYPYLLKHVSSLTGSSSGLPS